MCISVEHACAKLEAAAQKVQTLDANVLSLEAEIQALVSSHQEKLSLLNVQLSDARHSEMVARRHYNLAKSNEVARVYLAYQSEMGEGVLTRSSLRERLDRAIRARVKGASELDASFSCARTFGEAIIWRLENSQSYGGFSKDTLDSVVLIVLDEADSFARLKEKFLTPKQSARAWEVLTEYCPHLREMADGSPILCPPYELMTVSSDCSSLRPVGGFR